MISSSIDDLTDAICEAGFGSNAEFFSDYADGITCELFDTGSVEVEIGDRTFLLHLIISEERNK